MKRTAIEITLATLIVVASLTVMVVLYNHTQRVLEQQAACPHTNTCTHTYAQLVGIAGKVPIYKNVTNKECCDCGIRYD